MMQKYSIGPMPAALDGGLVEKLQKVETATIGHFRHRGFVNHSIMPLGKVGQTLVGTAGHRRHSGAGFDPAASCRQSAAAGRLYLIDRLGDDRHACSRRWRRSCAQSLGGRGDRARWPLHRPA